MTLNRGAAHRLKTCKEKGLCVACMKPHGDSRMIRGCHESCRRATQRKIDAGEWTEEQRMREGKLLANAAGRPTSHPITLEP